MSKKYDVLVIGAGVIGASYDYPASAEILTHAHAFLANEGFNLCGFVDSDTAKAASAAETWQTKYYKNIEEAFNAQHYDVVSVTVPDEYHYDVLLQLVDYPIKFVFAEKPLVDNTVQGKEIIRIYEKAQIPILVNYSRRFIPEIERIKHCIQSGKIGRFICGNGYYGKGILHNGSHMVDLLRYLIGEIVDSRVIKYDFDFYEDDPSVSAVLELADNKLFTLNHVPCNHFTVFEMDLLFENGRVRITDVGQRIEYYDIFQSNTFQGYKFAEKSQEINTTYTKAMYFAVQNIFDYLDKGQALKCSMLDGYKAVEICEKLKAVVL